MSTSELADSLLASDAFERTLQAIAVGSALQDLSAVKANYEAEEVEWRYALRCASLLASVQMEAAQDAALRIAQACLAWEDDPAVGDGHRRAAAVILERMGNHRALELAEKRDLISSGDLKEVPHRWCWT